MYYGKSNCSLPDLALHTMPLPYTVDLSDKPRMTLAHGGQKPVS